MLQTTKRRFKTSNFNWFFVAKNFFTIYVKVATVFILLYPTYLSSNFKLIAATVFHWWPMGSQQTFFFVANGFIHYMDFMEIMARRGDQTEIMTEDELAEVFSVFDMDGCGKITANDLREAMAALGNSITEEEAEELISKADTDEDGMVNVTGTCIRTTDIF